MLRSLCLIAVALIASACAGVQPQAPITRIEPQRCDRDWQLRSASQLSVDASEAREQRMDGSSRCLDRGTGPIAYLPFRLPAYRAPYSITIDSEMAGTSLFAPEVFLLNGVGQAQRSVPYERFSVRGNKLRATVFINGGNASERYLVVASSATVVGKVEEKLVSKVTPIPVPLGLVPMLYVDASEYQGQYVLTHNGVLRLHARSAASSERREERVRPADRADRYASGDMVRRQ